MLQISELETGYGQKQVPAHRRRSLWEIVALIRQTGPITLLKAVCGLIGLKAIRFEGNKLNSSTCQQLSGITLCRKAAAYSA